MSANLPIDWFPSTAKPGLVTLEQYLATEPINPFRGSGDPGRDAWVTPYWLAELLGTFDLDPCSNARSHIRAWRNYQGTSAADDGLLAAAEVPAFARVFVNPPYSRGQVIRWVRAYKHTDFTFLVRWDPSTAWFQELLSAAGFFWFLTGERLEFEPPPGVKGSANPFPHALISKNPLPCEIVRKGAVFLLDKSLAVPHN